MRVFEIKAECTCRYCGRTFLAKTNRSTVCDSEECRRKQRNEWGRNSTHTKTIRRRTTKHKTASSQAEWKRIIKEADKSGLSYGQYVARKDNAGL